MGKKTSGLIVPTIGLLILFTLERLDKRMGVIEDQIKASTASTSAALDAAQAALEDISGDVDELLAKIGNETVSQETADAAAALSAKASSFVDALKTAADKVPETTNP